MPKQNIDESIKKYENFINDVLKEDLRILHLKLNQINLELTDLIEQRHTIKVVNDKKIHPDGFKSQIHIGCNFFMEASVPDTSTILMNVGLNYYLEFSVEEAIKYLDVRIKSYEKASEEICIKAAATKAHIKLTMFGINELVNKKGVKR